MNFPIKIYIKSDDTELELVPVDTAPKSKEVFVTYRYTKAYVNLGKIIRWSEAEFNTLVRKEIITF